MSAGTVIVSPPDRGLAQRVRTGRGKSLAELEQAGAAVVANLRPMFLEQMLAMAADVTARHAALPAGGDERLAALREVYRLAHDIKGMAPTFGAHLAGHCAASLCAVLLKGDMDSPRFREVVATHVAALGLVAEQTAKGALEGMGGEAGGKLADGLSTAAARVLLRDAPENFKV